MKRKAFIQAIILILLLGGSWLALIYKFQATGKEVVVTPEIQAEEIVENPIAPDPREAVQSIPTDPRDVVPEDWHEWWDYFDAQQSPGEMRGALDALADLIQTMEPELASTWLMEFLASGADMKTGLAFQLKGDGRLLGTASLRAFMLDLLQSVDPEAAGVLARQELETQGVALVPDVYVIQMRNFALAVEGGYLEDNGFLESTFASMLNHQPWMKNPNAAIAEAMDIAVYLENTRFVSNLADFLHPEQPQMLRHASALTLERLVDLQPLDTLEGLIPSIPGNPEIYKTRAGYFARMDPSGAGASRLLETYLTSNGLSREEQVFFLNSFPNLNRSLSYNLLSTQNTNTAPGSHVDRLQSALDQVRKWQNEDAFMDLQEVLIATEGRIQSQITGDPFP